MMDGKTNISNNKEYIRSHCFHHFMIQYHINITETIMISPCFFPCFFPSSSHGIAGS